MARHVSPATFDEKQVLAQFEKVLAAEREDKRRQIKNLLTVEQQDKLRVLRVGGGNPR